MRASNLSALPQPPALGLAIQPVVDTDFQVDADEEAISDAPVSLASLPGGDEALVHMDAAVAGGRPHDLSAGEMDTF
jgi:hypothetical protein